MILTWSLTSSADHRLVGDDHVGFNDIAFAIDIPLALAT